MSELTDEVRAEADRLVAISNRAGGGWSGMYAVAAVVEGLRAELAERDAKIRAIVAAIHAEIRDPYAASVAPSICEAVDAAIEVIESAALRAAGGQEKPNEPTNWHNWDCNRTNCSGCYDGPRP